MFSELRAVINNVFVWIITKINVEKESNQTRRTPLETLTLRWQIWKIQVNHLNPEHFTLPTIFANDEAWPFYCQLWFVYYVRLVNQLLSLFSWKHRENMEKQNKRSCESRRQADDAPALPTSSNRCLYLWLLEFRLFSVSKSRTIFHLFMYQNYRDSFIR